LAERANAYGACGQWHAHRVRLSFLASLTLRGPLNQLARAVDRRSLSPAFPQRSSSANNLAEVRYSARRWATQVRRHLDEFTKL
jgi:hypothetical protein